MSLSIGNDWEISPTGSLEPKGTDWLEDLTCLNSSGINVMLLQYSHRIDGVRPSYCNGAAQEGHFNVCGISFFLKALPNITLHYSLRLCPNYFGSLRFHGIVHQEGDYSQQIPPIF
jgi:hypothetical protein